MVALFPDFGYFLKMAKDETLTVRVRIPITGYLVSLFKEKIIGDIWCSEERNTQNGNY